MRWRGFCRSNWGWCRSNCLALVCERRQRYLLANVCLPRMRLHWRATVDMAIGGALRCRAVRATTAISSATIVRPRQLPCVCCATADRAICQQSSVCGECDAWRATVGAIGRRLPYATTAPSPAVRRWCCGIAADGATALPCERGWKWSYERSYERRFGIFSHAPAA